MWFPTKTQSVIESKMGIIKKYFIEYYGEKYRDIVEERFKDFVFVTTHAGLGFEQTTFQMKVDETKVKYMHEFLNILGITEKINDFNLCRLYDVLLEGDVKKFIALLDGIYKGKTPLYLKVKMHTKDLKITLYNCQNEIDNINGYHDFLELKNLLEGYQIEYLKEVYKNLPEEAKKIYDDPKLSDKDKLYKLKEFVPFISFDSSSLEFQYEMSLENGNKQKTFGYHSDFTVTEKDILELRKVRIKYQEKLKKYLNDTYESFLKIASSKKEHEYDFELFDDFNSTCSIQKTVKNGRESIFSYILLVLPVEDSTCIHEINHHVESYIDESGNLISGWRPVFSKKAKKGRYCNMLLDEVINDLITDDIISLMQDDGVYILDNNRANECDYAPFKSIVERFFNEFKELIIESRIGGNPKLLFDTLGKDNMRELNNLFFDMLKNSDNALEVDEEYIDHYASLADAIIEKMIEYRKHKMI